VQKHLFEEECALAGAPRIMPFGPVMVAPVIMAFGNPEQQKRFLPGIASGEVWWSQGYSEPGSGSDLASVKTRAERVGDKYIVNGQKTWTTLGQYGDWMFNLVRTSTEGKPQTGISFLLLDMKSPGVTVRPIKLLDGECEVNEVFFDNVEVPAENLIGEENKGWTYAKHLLSHERTNIADVNRSKRELERLKRIAKPKACGTTSVSATRSPCSKWTSWRWRCWCCACCRPKSRARTRSTSPACSRSRAARSSSATAELMMLAAGPFAMPFIEEAMEAGWHRRRLPRRRHRQRAAGIHLLQPAQDHHLRWQQRSAKKHRARRRARLNRSALCTTGLLPRAPSGRGFQIELRWLYEEGATAPQPAQGETHGFRFF
jgi:hypothetical protein